MPLDAPFDVPAAQCPLLKKYVKAALQLMPDSGYLYADDRAGLLSLASNTVGTHQCSASAQLLRAFYCVEAVHMWLAHLDRVSALGYVPAPADRTWGGLMQLQDQLQACREQVDVHQKSIRLHGKSTKMSYAVVVKGLLPKMLLAIDHLLTMIWLLLPALSREEPDLAKLGTLLAASVSDVGVPSLFLKHAHNLKNITEENGITPWELTELQESFST